MKSVSPTATVLQRMPANSTSIASAIPVMANWRYIEFVNPKQHLPCISLEWLVGARGLLAGRIMQLRASTCRCASAFMSLQYEAAQMLSQATCIHIGPEGAALGWMPGAVDIVAARTFEDCLAAIDKRVCAVRGTAGVERRNSCASPALGLEPPIVIGIDVAGVLDRHQGSDTQMLQSYFRDRLGWLRDTQTLVMFATHFKPQNESDEEAQEPFGIHVTYGVDVHAKPWRDKAAGVQLGDVVTLRTFKNKLSPRYREIDMFLLSGQGFDLVKTDTEFLLGHPASPISKEDCYRHGQGITCKPLSKKSFKTPEDFLRALYGNTDYVMSLREKLRMRGCGFDFETKYMKPSALEDDPDYEGFFGTTPPAAVSGNRSAPMSKI